MIVVFKRVFWHVLWQNGDVSIWRFATADEAMRFVWLWSENLPILIRPSVHG